MTSVPQVLCSTSYESLEVMASLDSIFTVLRLTIKSADCVWLAETFQSSFSLYIELEIISVLQGLMQRSYKCVLTVIFCRYKN